MIRILLVDDQNLVQQGIKSLLDQDRELKVVGTVKDGRSAIKQIDLLRPDIVLLDIEMPGMNGISVTKYITHFLPQTKVIILSSHEDKKYLVQALMAGAKAYILKSSLMKDLKQAILAVDNGYFQIESRLLAKVLHSSKIKPPIAKHSYPKAQSVSNYNINAQKSLDAKKTNQTKSGNNNSLQEASTEFEDTDSTDSVVLEPNLSQADIRNSLKVDQENSSSQTPDYATSEQMTKIQVASTEEKTKIPEANLAESVVSANKTAKAGESAFNQFDYFQPLSDRASSPINVTAVNQNALVRVSKPSLTQQQILLKSHQNRRELGRTSGIKNYWRRLSNRPEIRPYKSKILAYSRPILSKYKPVFEKYKLQLLLFINHKKTRKWLSNIGLIFLGAAIVLILHSL